MPITKVFFSFFFFSWEWINNFPNVSYGRNLFGIHLVWYKSKDLLRIKDIYQGTTIKMLYDKIWLKFQRDMNGITN